MPLVDKELQSKLQQELADNPRQFLDAIADKYQCSVEVVINCLPAEIVMKTRGERFIEILQTIASWKESVLFFAHTEDTIVEVVGQLPTGSVAHGFYNFEHAKEGLNGHLRYQNCKAIYLLDRSFMEKRSVSLHFINHQGKSMFQIFAGRDNEGKLLENQIQAMKELIKA